MSERQQLETIGARLDQLVTLVQRRLSDRLDQVAAGLATVQDKLTAVQDGLAEVQAQLAVLLAAREAEAWIEEPTEEPVGPDVPPPAEPAEEV